MKTDVYIYICILIYLYTYLFVYLFIYLFIYLFMYLFILGVAKTRPIALKPCFRMARLAPRSSATQRKERSSCGAWRRRESAKFSASWEYLGTRAQMKPHGLRNFRRKFHKISLCGGGDLVLKANLTVERRQTGVAQNSRARGTQVLVFGSICQGGHLGTSF